MAKINGELIITVQPKDSFRFRTLTDLTHGTLQGLGGHISVTLIGYEGDKRNVIILCTSYQEDKPFPHPNLLIKSEGVGDNKIQFLDPIKSELNENWIATFPGMVIVRPTKKNKPEEVLNDKLIRIREYNPNYVNSTNGKVDMNMNNIRLRFEAFQKINKPIGDPVFLPIGDPVYSNVITNNTKNFIDNDFLWFCTNCNGPATGGTELIIVFEPKKSKKEDVKIKFYQPDSRNTSENIWQACVDKKPINFCPHSFVIKTPTYQNINITEDVRVHFELFADGKRSQHLEFIYKPNPVQRAGQKRKQSEDNKSDIDKIIACLPSTGTLEDLKTSKGLIKLFNFSKLQPDGKEDVQINHRIPIPSISTNNNNNNINNELELLKELKEEEILHKLIEENAEIKLNKLLKVIEKHNFGKQILNLQNDNGDTSLHIACYFNRTEYIEKLLKLGADPNIRNFDGNTALHIAIEKTDIICISKILDNQILNIELSNDKGYSALYLAIFLKKYNIAKTLITTGNAEIDFENPTNGNNILHLLVTELTLGNINETEDMIRFLLEKISINDLNIENRWGLTPLALALEFGTDAQNIIDLLLNGI